MFFKVLIIELIFVVKIKIMNEIKGEFFFFLFNLIKQQKIIFNSLVGNLDVFLNLYNYIDSIFKGNMRLCYVIYNILNIFFL